MGSKEKYVMKEKKTGPKEKSVMNEKKTGRRRSPL